MAAGCERAMSETNGKLNQLRDRDSLHIAQSTLKSVRESLNRSEQSELRDRDSNPNFRFQRATCYHYTIPQRKIASQSRC